MPNEPKYAVKFVGYSADVLARKNGRDVEYAGLDFVTGSATVRSDYGWVMVSKLVDLNPFVKGLPNLAGDLLKLLYQHRISQLSEDACSDEGAGVATNMISLSYGQNTVCIAPDADVDEFIRQVTDRFMESEQVLRQAEQLGSRITRRPYSDYVDEIKETGFCRVESHGFGLFVDGRLFFYPKYQVALIEFLDEHETSFRAVALSDEEGAWTL